jgi:TRAP-type transport system small permease protein
MAVCLGVMATVVFLNVVLRYGFNTGIPAMEELSRLLFVWLVFIGATAAYPAGNHMAFTSLVQSVPKSALPFLTRLIHALVALTSGWIAWGAWQQVSIGWDSTSVVLQYPSALLPLPAFLCCSSITVMAFIDALRGKSVGLEEDSGYE